MKKLFKLTERRNLSAWQSRYFPENKTVSAIFYINSFCESESGQLNGMSNHLQLVNTASGHEFKTYNSAVISSVLEVIRKTLDEKITEVEAQIRF